MPDSFSSPPWGQPSFDDRDLDSLLAGGTDVPDVLRPVAETLSALKSAPSPTELRSEAFVRAQFRGTPRIDVPARRAARRRTVAWFPGVVTAAAVIVLLVAIAYSGHLPGPAQQIAHDTIAAPSARHNTGGPSPSVQTASAQPAPSGSKPAADGTPTASASPGIPNRTALCDEFWSAMQHPQADQGSWQTPLYDELSDAAGGPQQVYAYCYPVWNQKFARQSPLLPSFPPYFPKSGGYTAPGTGASQQRDGDQGDGVTHGNDQSGDSTSTGGSTSTGDSTSSDSRMGDSSPNSNVAPTTSTGGTGVSHIARMPSSTSGSANAQQQGSGQ